MIEPSQRHRSIRPLHAAGVAGVVLVAAVVAYAALGFIVGTLWFFVKLAVVVGLGVLAMKALTRRRRRP